MKKSVAYLSLATLLLTACGGAETTVDEIAYTNIDASELVSMLEDKDFFLVDVCVTDDDSIEGSDALIPYDDIKSHLEKLPEDKDASIVVYCKGGVTSELASEELVELGYKNVKNLEGGIQAYNEFVSE